MKTSSVYILLLIVGISLLGFLSVKAEGIVRLEGRWKFRVGDRMEWASKTYDDSDWDDIRVPSRWEDQGYQGYDGFAWYRVKVVVPESFELRGLEIHLGYIDDVDEVFINGEKVGQSGSFPPNFSTAYDARRVYQLPHQLVNFGEENLIAIRVYDAQVSGGLLSGDFNILAKEEIPRFDIDLAGQWMFNTGRQIDESRSKPIHVPGLWENQGYNNYDGYAVYFKKVRIPKELASEQLVIMAGKIDDVDQLFINGHFVGETGQFYPRSGGSMYQELRNYVIQRDVILPGQENLIEIRVHDDRWDGGIVEGPIGIITQNEFRKYWKSKRNN